MKITILIPHWKTGKQTAYSIAQILKYKGKHDVKLIIIDNNAGDGSAKYFEPFSDFITYVPYPSHLLQSHGIAFDYALENGLVETDYFITMESDSFPVKEGWLDYYEKLIIQEVDLAASELSLSGGTYYHPCGAMYYRKFWDDAKWYCDQTEYAYFPNLAIKSGFPCHLMVHDSILKMFLDSPEDFVEVSDPYKNDGVISRQKFIDQQRHYKTVVNPFHNGMGMKQESLHSYGKRTVESEMEFVILNNKSKLIYRMGAEPGQWLSWYAAACGKKIFKIPTETIWMKGKENIQQEYTLNEAGVKHLWGISAYHNLQGGDEQVKLLKQSTPEELYETLPEHQKIK